MKKKDLEFYLKTILPFRPYIELALHLKQNPTLLLLCHIHFCAKHSWHGTMRQKVLTLGILTAEKVGNITYKVNQYRLNALTLYEVKTPFLWFFVADK